MFVEKAKTTFNFQQYVHDERRCEEYRDAHRGFLGPTLDDWEHEDEWDWGWGTGHRGKNFRGKTGAVPAVPAVGAGTEARAGGLIGSDGNGNGNGNGHASSSGNSNNQGQQQRQQQ